MEKQEKRDDERPAGDTSFHVRSALGGDDRSWEWIVAHLSPLLEIQAEYRLGSSFRHLCDPEDLVHEAWIVTLSRADELRPRDGHLTPVLLRFLSTTLLQNLNNRIRKFLRRGERPLELDGETGSRSPAFIAHTTGILDRAARSEARSALREALLQLAPHDREVLVLLGIEQLSPGEVAQTLQIKPSALSMRYRRALERIRSFLPEGILDAR